MNEQDKLVARRALEQKRLTIEQVEEVRVEVDRSGRSFEAVAVERGLLKPVSPPVDVPVPQKRPHVPAPAKPKIPLLYLALMAASFVIFAGLLIATVVKMRQQTAHDQDLAVEQSRNMTEADRRSSEARIGYQRSIVERREARAKEALAKARLAMTRAAAAPANSPEATLALNDAFTGFNAYLDVLPDDADVRVERARTHQMRRNYDLAIVDLERAAELKPDRAAALKDQVAQLRLLLARTPK